MKLQVIAVRDSASETFMNPFCVTHQGIAIRSFVDETRSPDGPIGKHPDDYDLYCLGTFDQETGELANEPERIARGRDYVPQ